MNLIFYLYSLEQIEIVFFIFECINLSQIEVIHGIFPSLIALAIILIYSTNDYPFILEFLNFLGFKVSETKFTNF